MSPDLQHDMTYYTVHSKYDGQPAESMKQIKQKLILKRTENKKKIKRLKDLRKCSNLYDQQFSSLARKQNTVVFEF